MAQHELREQGECSGSSHLQRLRTERAGEGRTLGKASWPPAHTDHRLGILIFTQPQSVQHRAGEPRQPIREPLPNGSGIYVFHTAGIHNHVDALQQEGVQAAWLPPVTTTCVITLPWVAGPTPMSPGPFRTWKNSATLATWLAQAHLRASGTSSPTCKVPNKGVGKGRERAAD